MTRLPAPRVSAGLLLLTVAAFSSITITSVEGADDGPELNDFGQKTYGVDVSFPIHHEKVVPVTQNPLGVDKQAF